MLKDNVYYHILSQINQYGDTIKNEGEKSKEVTGLKMKAYRAYHKLTQEGLAKKLGVSRLQIARWENGKNKPNKLAMDLLKKEGILKG